MRVNFRPHHKLQATISSLEGYVLSTKPLPISNAGSFNFVFEFGAGLEYYLERHRSVRLEYQVQHYSNHDSANANPGVDNGMFKLTYNFGWSNRLAKADLIASRDPEVHTLAMRFEARVGEHGEILIPDEVREELKLKPEMAVLVQVTALVDQPMSREPDWEQIDQLVSKLSGPMRTALLADGYASFEEYIDDVRGR